MSPEEKKNTEQNKIEYDPITNEPLVQGESYDGIKELDNDMPTWYKWLFYLTIVFAVIYLVRIFIFKAPDLIQADEYAAEMTKFKNSATEKKAASFVVKLQTSPAALAKGNEIWHQICAACHRPDGGGLVGPNMTDKYWIHGNTVQDLYNVVTNGVIQKGMLSYKNQLSNQDRLDVVSYVLLKLQGTHPKNPKAPQGKLYK